MSLGRLAAAGAAAGVLQWGFLTHFALPLADYLHVEHAEGGEEAVWAAALVAAVAGALWGVVLHFFAVRVGLFVGAAAAFVAFSLLPGLKWLPTPHGVGYLEPVWWREAVHGLYLAYNGAVLFAAARLGGLLAPLAAGVALTLGFYAFPNFTLPEGLSGELALLRALQGLSIASWGLFWGCAAALAYFMSPLRRRLG